MGTAKIDGEEIHAFADLAYIKKMVEKIKKLFKNTIKNYVSLIEGVCSSEVDTSDLI